MHYYVFRKNLNWKKKLCFFKNHETIVGPGRDLIFEVETNENFSSPNPSSLGLGLDFANHNGISLVNFNFA